MNLFYNPFLMVDIVIELKKHNEYFPQIILIQRQKNPWGWALPGGGVNYGESVEQAAIREALEETGLTIELIALLGVYSNPKRDPRQHNVSIVFIARTIGNSNPVAGDDAAAVSVFFLNNIPKKLCFDHELILMHYREWHFGLRSAISVLL